jgi:hypothetical protein
VILVAIGLTLAAPGQIIAPEQAPVAWQAYAASAQGEIETLLGGDEPGAAELRDTLVIAPDGTPVQRELVLVIGVDAAGQVERAEIAALAAEMPVAAGAQLKALLLKRRLPGTPPVGMRQPMRLAVTVAPASAETSSNQGEVQ